MLPLPRADAFADAAAIEFFAARALFYAMLPSARRR